MRAPLALLLLVALPLAARASDLFRDRVAPLLEQRCLSCHDARSKRGGLNLSSRATALEGGDNGVVLVPGQSGKSRLLQVVTGPTARMPRSGPKLTSGEIALLRRWIDEGAVWPAQVTLTPAASASIDDTWWSLRPLLRPTLPIIRNRAWVRNPIDVFILAALEARQIAPAAEADRRTLIRRLSFDLLGLPPTPEEVEAFVNDRHPDAYERLVSRMLCSPAYGERWGRHWLDVAHYADTHGYDKDKRRDFAWRYRDWIIAALNSDMPYADFIRLQLAGDMLFPNDPWGIIATGFIAAGPWDFVGHVELREGTVDKEKTRLLDRDDMVQSAIGTFMSLTIGCARCHDHKFDPIPAREYYRLQAVFAGVERGNRQLPEVGGQTLLAERSKLSGERSAVQARIDSRKSPEVRKLDARLSEVRKELSALPAIGGTPSPSNGWHSAISPKADAVKWVQVDLGSIMVIDEVRLMPARPTDFKDSPGFGFPLRYKVEVSEEPTFGKPVLLTDATSADVPNPGDEIVSLPGKGTRGRYVRITATRLWKRLNDFVFALAEVQVDSLGRNAALKQPVQSLDSIEAGRWSRRFLVDDSTSRQRLPDLSNAKAAADWRSRVQLVRQKREIEDALGKTLARLATPEERKQLAEMDAKLAALDVQIRSGKTGALVYAPLPIPPRTIRSLKRGDVEQPREVVTPGGLSCVPGPSSEFAIDRPEVEGNRRLALANWVADQRNPLTWRSIVNRVWHYHFGKGIVDTPSDFGKMGSRPTHPELLDWLALHFRDNGGSLKDLHRLIVTSSAYRQSTQHNEAAARLDSDNRYLWRMNRRRLDAESVRDAVLAVSGKLDRRVGGAGYDLFRFKDDHSPVYDHTDINAIHNPATYRRTVYRFTVRSVPNPFLDSLDCADPNIQTPVRNTTLTALQALSLLNNPFMVRQAAHLADRLKAQTADVEQQVELAYRLAFGRAPGSEERRLVASHARTHGLAATCRVLLNANEFAFVD